MCSFQVERKGCIVQRWTACLPRHPVTWEPEDPHSARRVRRCAPGRRPTPRARRIRNRPRPGTPCTTSSHERSRRRSSRRSGLNPWCIPKLADCGHPNCTPSAQQLLTSPSLVSVRRARMRRLGQQPREAYVGNSDQGLMTHVSQKRGGQTLTPERIAKL